MKWHAYKFYNILKQGIYNTFKSPNIMILFTTKNKNNIVH